VLSKPYHGVHGNLAFWLVGEEARTEKLYSGMEIKIKSNRR
jgi:hypothetical protein